MFNFPQKSKHVASNKTVIDIAVTGGFTSFLLFICHKAMSLIKTKSIKHKEVTCQSLQDFSLNGPRENV